MCTAPFPTSGPFCSCSSRREGDNCTAKHPSAATPPLTSRRKMVSPAFFREGSRWGEGFPELHPLPGPPPNPAGYPGGTWGGPRCSPGGRKLPLLALGSRVWGLGAGREAGRIGWAPGLLQFPGQRRSPVPAAGSMDGLGPDSGLDLSKVSPTVSALWASVSSSSQARLGA